MVLTLRLLGLTTLDTDARLPQFAVPGPQGFWTDPQMCYDPPMRLSKVAASWWSVCLLSHVTLSCSMFVVTPCVQQYGFFFSLFFPHRLLPCLALVRHALFVLPGSCWSIISAIKDVIWAV